MQDRLLGGREQLVAPVNGRPEGLMPRWSRAGSVPEGGEAVVEPLGQLLGAEHPRPGGSDLQGQRESVQPLADPLDGIGVGFAQREVAVGIVGAGTEQSHRVRG
ncbi:MAG: hypothetical protein LC792_28875, partial [Actinobacteria bacterium]|nr:hypothetical protein [Actinomycetota bacterium]